MRPDELIIVLLAILTACSVAIASFYVLALILTKWIETWRDQRRRPVAAAGAPEACRGDQQKEIL